MEPGVPADGLIRVGMLASWCDSRTACELFNPMTTAGEYEWVFDDLSGARQRLRMTWDDHDPDYWVVLNAPQPADAHRLDPARTVVFHMEPEMWTDAMRPLWGAWAAPSPRSFLQVRDHRRYRNSNDWWLGLDYADLKQGELPPKNRTMAACVSAKYADPGHRKRIDFLRFLDGNDLDLDIYGDPSNGFRRGQGTTPPHDKRAALLPYRYYFDAENHSTPNFYTEKIVDCLLAETLCFYWGCPNLDSFFDPRAFIRLELDDFDADLARIRAAIADDEWSARLPYIQAEKQRILDDSQFFPTLARVVDPVRRARPWHVGAADQRMAQRWIGDARARSFVEISDRTGDPEVSETLDVERRLDWSGLCLEADADRAKAARAARDCTVAIDTSDAPIADVLTRNAVSPIAIEWLNLALDAPFEFLRPGGRLDPARVRANLISMPRATPEERRRCIERLTELGYEPADAGDDGVPDAVVRTGRDDDFGFYHLCTINTWRDVLAEQLERLHASGLAAATRRIFASVVGPAADEGRAALEAALGERLEIVHLSPDASSFERPILEHARRFCEHGEPLARAIWYLHAKGVSARHSRNANVADWRRLMEHFVVDRWPECVDALRDHDVCGVNWSTAPTPHFSGNFWWASPRYVATLPTRIGPGHFEPEAWIGTDQPRVASLHESGVDHYREPYPESRYRDPSAPPGAAPDRPATGRPTVCLNMIVKNEAHVVTEVLHDVVPHIDTWVIVDTGSTDGTPEVIRSFFAARGIPGALHHRPWRDFGTNRTEALELCASIADYAWVIDADDRVVGPLDLSALAADAYLVRYGTDFTYWRKQIFRLGLPWRFEGVVHEYAACAEPTTDARLEGTYHLESRRLGDRNRAADKYERDCRALHDALAADPSDARSTFYLAQSYRDAGDTQAALEWYTRRTELDGWDEETFCAHLERARLLERLDEPWEQALAAYLEAWQARPTRAEPLHEIARWYRSRGQYDLGELFAARAAAIPFPDDDVLFVAADVYRWRARDELALCAFYNGRPRESFDLCRTLLAEPSVPEADRERILANRDFTVDHMKAEASSYPAEIVHRLTKRAPNAADTDVTLTITTCRRRELFETTINSFLHCCEDLDRIGRWICIDDNSSEDDRARMQERYPFFEFVFKGPDERGHASSLDRLQQMVSTPYWLHLEDDWHFFAPERYVSTAVAILDSDARLGQVLFNRNYGETLASRSIAGGVVARTPDGIRYRVHEHLPSGTPEADRMFAALPPGTLSNAWWPHFSLRPSMLRTAAVAELAPFDRGAAHFELDAAHRYTEHGHVSAFFDSINCVHIGRLTSQRAAGGPPNAYELNGVPQFGEVPGGGADLDVRVVNLDRRADRWHAFVVAARTTAGDDFVGRCVRVAAVDGTTLVDSPEITHLFRGNDFGSRRAMIGCALSHLALWRAVAEGDAPVLVLEDDARLGDGFERALDEVRGQLRARGADPDVIFLGFHPVDPSRTTAGDSLRVDAMDWGDYIGGTFAYVISPAGASRLLAAAERDGIRHGIDRFVHYQGVSLSAWRCVPRLVHSPLAVSGTATDSDIQHDFAVVAPAGDRR